ncbi:prephenate dehydrogenase [Tichowtungia aerotolerans]|uniref:Prephenate dehydrogenase/arogenate dehydrogenase family protein n=1 Tax=Tichowtungia aerotolerans TaxID=2697043 RepID=A0A6P1MGB5_9BACT|nr:prephenate dehydrogenase [Tichowtungia aerotolerans]QHI70636.1 prephenate dehydrogenase/arogenate dehydrogenase family protein [Tichowtungia aerotolerans]
MKTLSIIGLGLMGSSLGLALKKRGVSVCIQGYARRRETCEEALELGAVDAAYTDPAEAVSGADLVVICVPIWTIAELAKAIVPALEPGAVVTDVGSTKTDLISVMEACFANSGACFIGSHPIAGSEKTGVMAGSPDLYEGRLAVVCPTDKTPAAAKDKVSNLWKCVGSEVVEMSAEQHDATLASTSHLPHMVAAALARSVGVEKADFCGTGFKDTSRVASGSADMWVDIIDTNRAALEAELDHFHEELQGLIAILRKGDSNDIRQWLEDAAGQRDRILHQNRFLK